MIKKCHKIVCFLLTILLFACKQKEDPFPQDTIEVSISSTKKLRLDQYEDFLDLSYDCISLQEINNFTQGYMKLIELLKKQKWNYDFICVEGFSNCNLKNPEFKGHLLELNSKVFGKDQVEFKEENGVLFIITKKIHK